MKNLDKPYILLLIVTIPQLILIGLFYKIFNVFKTELSQESIQQWGILGGYLVIACSMFTLYSIVNWVRRKQIGPWGAGSLFVTYTVFLILYFFIYRSIIPANVPNWMLMGISPGISVLTLIMPTLAYAIMAIVHWTVEKYHIKETTKDMPYVIGIPVIWYIGGNIFARLLWRVPFLRSLEQVVAVGFIASMSAFFFFFIRVIYVFVRQKSYVDRRKLTIVVLIGSLLGLGLNQSLGNLFGDFTHHYFYILAFLNGAFLALPAVNKPSWRLGGFFLKSILFLFSMYFFIVFLPYLPLAIIGLIFLGVGILMLIPLVLFLIHAYMMWEDYGYLEQFYPKKQLIAIWIMGILVIPTVILATIHQDKKHVDSALKYTYQRSFSEGGHIELNMEGVERALENIKRTNNNRGRGFASLSRGNTPYLTSLYNRYVLDNLSLSNERINELENIFFGKLENRVEESTLDQQQGKVVFIKGGEEETTFDESEGVYKSWIHLELENEGTFQEEFFTSFDLPKGSYISNYYLYVGQEKKYGLMADKRAANWIYQQIRSIRRDPGILTYVGEDHIEFRVFPFEGKEVRKTGIEIVHRLPINISIDGRTFALGEDTPSTEENKRPMESIAQIAYVPGEEKENLKKIIRDIRYYFVVDYGVGSEDNIQQYKERIKSYIKDKSLQEKVEEIVLVNFAEKPIQLRAHWENDFDKFQVKGGFNLDYTIKRILYEHYVENKDTYPAIVVVTDDLSRGRLTKDFDYWKFTSPEGLYYYHLDRSGKLTQYDLRSTATDRGQYTSNITTQPVFVWEDTQGRNFYLPDDQGDSLILLNEDFSANIEEQGKTKWEQGVLLKAMHMSYMLQPEQHLEKSLGIVKQSIAQGVMSPLTSLIVLETEAQEKIMLEKQKQILATKRPLDIDTMEGMTQMNEPSFMLSALLLVGIITLVEKYRKRRYDRFLH